MNAEDMQRFEIEAHPDPREYAGLTVMCRRCLWTAVLDGLLTLAELVQRAEEHTEVCR